MINQQRSTTTINDVAPAPPFAAGPAMAARSSRRVWRWLLLCAALAALTLVRVTTGQAAPLRQADTGLQYINFDNGLPDTWADHGLALCGNDVEPELHTDFGNYYVYETSGPNAWGVHQWDTWCVGGAATGVTFPYYEFSEPVTITAAHAAVLAGGAANIKVQYGPTFDPDPASAAWTSIDGLSTVIGRWVPGLSFSGSEANVIAIGFYITGDEVPGLALLDDIYITYECPLGDCDDDYQDYLHAAPEPDSDIQYLDMDDGLPLGWYDNGDKICGATNVPWVQPTFGNDNVTQWEHSGPASWGLKDVPPCPAGHYGWVHTIYEFPEPVTVTAAHGVCWSLGECWLRYEFGTYSEYTNFPGVGGASYGPWLEINGRVPSITGWHSVAKSAANYNDVIAVSFLTKEYSTPPQSGYTAWDDISIEYECPRGPCPATVETIPFTEADFIDYPCNYDNQGCPRDAWLRAEHGSNVYNTISGTVVGDVAQTDGSYEIYVQSPGGLTRRYANLLDDYVNFGDTVIQGCLLGVAADFPPSITGYDEGYANAGLSYLKQGSGGWGEAVPDDFGYPDGSGDFCGAAYRSDRCMISDPSLQKLGTKNDNHGWQLSNLGFFSNPLNINNPVPAGHPLDGGGMLLWVDISNAPYLRYILDDNPPTLSQQIVMNPAQSYYVTVVAALTHQANPIETLYAQWGVLPVALDVQLGDADIVRVDLPLDVGDAKSVLDFGQITPIPDGTGNLTTVQVTNRSYGNPVAVYYVCISSSTIRQSPGDCYFLDNNFDTPITDPPWDYSGASSQPVWIGDRYGGSVVGNSYLELASADSLSQPVTLYDDRGVPFNYTLSIMATPADATSNPADYALLDVDWGTFSQQFTFDYTDVLTEQPQRQTFSVAAETSDDFTFAVSSLAGSVTSLNVDWVCLQPNGSAWPGYDEGAIPSALKENKSNPNECQPCHRPDSWTDLGAWLEMLVCVMGRLWACMAAPLINDIYYAIIGLGRFLYAIGTWLGTLLGAVLAWLRLFVIAAINAVLAAVGALLNAVLALDWFGFVMDAIGYGAWALGWFFTTSATLLDLLGRAIGLIGSIGLAINRMIAALIAAINSASQAAIDVPDCGDPDDPLYPLCRGLYLVDQVMPMSLITPLAFGALGIFLIWWTVNHWSTGLGAD